MLLGKIKVFIGSHAYLNRAALVGCKNQLLSENYAKQLYTRRYLRDTSVTGRLGDIQGFFKV
jgi:hypothetical protein